ncbi:hypothetical protein MP228_004176 [Amoeboaphelidium protococcarum]|nr:hypothetical protein MP228_004176 [Amoeboaphelidium protococcarum]
MPNDNKREVDGEPAQHIVDDFQSINVEIFGFGVDSVHWTQKDKKFLLLDHEQYGACLTCIGEVKYVNDGENGRSLQISLNPFRQQNKLFYEQMVGQLLLEVMFRTAAPEPKLEIFYRKQINAPPLMTIDP